MFTDLKLPNPSNELINKCYEISGIAPLELALKAKHDYVQNYKVNSVSRKFIEDNTELNELAVAEFGGCFRHHFIPAVGIVKNTQTDTYACWPPHTDRTRIFALNYYIEEGGDNVTTISYQTHDDFISGEGTGKIFKYEDLTIDTVYHLKMNQWYALDARQVHSIENIKTTRLIFTLSFLNLTFFEFVDEYKHFLL
jgi:hypothetical protein